MPSLTRSACAVAGDVAAGQQHASARRRQHAGEQIDERGLAGAVGADQRVARAGGELEVDFLHGHERAEMAAQRLRLQANLGHGALRLRAIAPPQRLAEAENPVAGKQRDQHQQQPEAELPGGRIDLRQKMLQRQIDDGADERAVEPSVAAENENDEHGRGAVETEHAEIDVGRGLRPQPAGDAGERRRNGVADDQPRAAPASRSRACAARFRGCRSGSGRTANRPACARTESRRRERRARTDIACRQ